MFSDDRSNTISKQALNFPVGLLINSPKRRLAKLGRKPSNGSVQSSSSDTNTGSNESTGVRQPAKNKIRRHNNRLSTVFSRSPHLKDNQSDEDSTVADGMHLTDDPSELSMQLSAPGVLKIFGSEISTGANYKSVLATSHSSAQELVKEALERYSLDKAEAGAYVLCDVIGRLGEEHQWKTECFRVVGDNEKPLMLQSLWKPKEGFCRRFEIQRKSSVEKKTAKEKDTVTAGINAQARKLQKIRSRGASVFIEEDLNSNFSLWRSLSEVNLSVKSKDPRMNGKSLLLEDLEPEVDKEGQCLGLEKEETESSDDNTTQYSIHPPFEFPYFLLLQGYSYRQEKTKELAGIQPETVKQDPDELSLLSIKELIPGLQPLAFWMSNSIELLHFIQQEVPKLLLWGEEGGEIADSQVSATRSASEEAMTVLEEVIMFTFQQSVYYLTKTLYTALPGLLDSNPFSESGQLRVPDGVNHILEILKETLQLLNQYEVHSEIASQLFAYLFFFTNASLFNALMERGSGGGFYQWSRGVQIRANLDLLLDWIQGIGLGDLALDFFHKLSTAVNLLATPKQNLLQASWLSLRSEFASLNPAQLHHMLREYNPGRPCPAGWSPTPEEAEPAMRMADILESFDNHPPLILPCSSFHIELGRPVQDLRLPSQLSRIREFLCSLKQSSPVPSQQEVPLAAESVTSACCTSSMKNTGPLQDSDTPKDRESDIKDSSLCGRFLLPGPSDLSSCGDVLTQKLKNLELQSSLPGQNDLTSHKRLALDPSCLLTPPNTPQTLELAEADTDLLERPFRHFLNGSHKGGDDKDLATPKVKGVLNPSPEPGTQNKPGEEDEVFTVELERGPHGLGLALVDGLKTPLKMSGIYIKSLVPHSPAARSKKLGLGDRILAINGTSLAGVDYNTGRDLIRSSGDKLRLLVAKSEAQALTTKIPIDLGFEISIPKVKFAMVNLSNHRKMTRDMIEVLFSKEEMATSSVNGRKSNTKENAVMKSSLCKCAATVSDCGENCHKDHNGIQAKRCGHSLQR
ncbi:Ras-associating and dilute domain-containing protein [Acipenser ruthenus]|uniref:Ras-associating and dilute domain-containing protein n=1 Tax=Acipenser ruthenus TaxID=7906 RepID=A0A662YWE9_ACIRT|nr:Ras-associating and dilute domain-containing protein [Acipenser ruthenus]